MAASGAGVLQLRSVEYARNHGVRIHCRSSFDDAPGTVVVGEEETDGTARSSPPSRTRPGEARVTLLGVPDTPGIAGRISTALADANVNVDMIIQNEPRRPRASARRHVVHRARRTTCAPRATALAPLAGELGHRRVATDEAMGKVSIVGAGMKSHPGVAAKVFTTLGDEGINIEMISTSPIKISCVIRGDRVAGRRARAAHRLRAARARTRSGPEQPFGEFA